MDRPPWYKLFLNTNSIFIIWNYWVHHVLTFIIILIIIKTAIGMRTSLIIAIFAACALSVKFNAITSARLNFMRCAPFFVFLICSAALFPIQIGKRVIRRAHEQVWNNKGTVPNNSYRFWADLILRGLFLGYGWHPWILNIDPKCHATLVY